MFQEINPAFFKEPDENKSWFRDAENNCELFVWKNTAQKIIRFQLWYEDYLVEWDTEKGFKSGLLEPEVGAFRSYQSPSFRYHHRFAAELISKMKQMLNPQNNEESLPDALRFVHETILNQH